MNRPAFGLALVALLLAGCGGAEVNPGDDLARAALDRALTAWKSGQPPGELQGGPPVVQAVDDQWRNGRKLADYAVTAEKPADPNPRFAVSLTLTSPAETITTEYVLVGTDPIWVYRTEDFARAMDMGNNPAPPKKRQN